MIHRTGRGATIGTTWDGGGRVDTTGVSYDSATGNVKPGQM